MARRNIGPRESRSYLKSTRHVVRDFDTLEDLVGHAAHELGATHVSGDGPTTKIYFPRGGTHPYEAASVRRKGGYWHADGPGAREGVAKLPAGAKTLSGAPRSRRAAEVRDYEAVDSRNRRIAGPFKSFGDAKQAAGTGGHVKYVRPQARVEARRRDTKQPDEQAYAAGEKYGQDQIGSDHFLDWVYDQLIEASKMPADKVVPLETKADANEIARKMLQQLVWDAQREGAAQEELGPDASREEIQAFYEGFRGACDTSRGWLADELLTKKSELKGPKAHGSVPAQRSPTSKNKSSKGVRTSSERRRGSLRKSSKSKPGKSRK